MKRIIKSIIALISVVLLSSCSLPGLSNAADSDTITIASLGSTEAEIMGFIVEGMVEHYIPIDANRITNLGSSSMNHAALQTGDA
ncbi:osmoprotectant ABC transporter substrate-binding protein, partial [Actinotignum timonense]|nr:osmoprotectant ABC transporter substrate-binding protein [Actinotignum timonense]